MFRKYKRFTTAIVTAAMVMAMFTPSAAMEKVELVPKTVTGLITLSGGNGRVEDVKISIRYGANIESDIEWTGSPDSNGRYSIPTDVNKGTLAVINVKAELPGYSSRSKSLFLDEDTADLILVADSSATAYNVSGWIKMDGANLPANLSPVINFNVTNLSRDKNIEAHGGYYTCAAPAGCDVLITPSLEGYTFSPESARIDKIGRHEGNINFTMTKVGESAPETSAPSEPAPSEPAPSEPAPPESAPSESAPSESAPPETEESHETVTLYFMTGSSPDDPGEVFAQYEVPKNSRKNTTTVAKTIGSSKPEKEGYTFSHWRERSLKDPSKMGNKVSGVIWTDDTDQYIYAQYKKNKTEETVKLYFMTGSSPDEPGEVFAEFDVPKNSRGNTTTIAKTIKTAVPCKVGCEFSHWREAKLSDPSVLGNKVSGVIWTNDTDQYIYAQYK